MDHQTGSRHNQLTAWEKLFFIAIAAGTPVIIYKLAKRLGEKAYETAQTRLNHGASTAVGDVLGFAGGGILVIAASAVVFAIAFIVFAIYVSCALFFGILVAALVKS